MDLRIDESKKLNTNLSDSSVELCAKGLSQFSRFRADAMQHIDASINADSNYCLPKIAKACMLQGANDDRFSGQVSQLIEQSEARLSPGATRESALLKAVSHAAQGRGVEAATVLEHHLFTAPTDLFAHVLLQEQTFWLGQPRWMRDTIERAAPAWSSANTDIGPFLSLRAFANEESGHFDLAEKYGREAVEIDPTDVWGAHAVAHVLVMTGEMERGIEWLESLSINWGHANQMRHHLWWHLCLFLLELGEHDRVVSLLDTEVRNPNSTLVQESPAATIDIGNYASLLMRLELYGLDVSSQWQTLSTICGERVSNHGSAFSNVHDMMVLCATEQVWQANVLLSSMKKRFALSDSSNSQSTAYKLAGIPVCEALMAYAAKDYDQVLKTLGGIRHQLHLMGASHAQRDVFYHLLVYAAEQEGRSDLRQIFLHDIERLGFCNVPQRAAYGGVGPR